jgi:hypothetical protein
MTDAGADKNGDVHEILTDEMGRTITVMRAADNPIRKTGILVNVNETTIWDPTAGKKWVITDLIISASAFANVEFRDGTGGAIWLELYIAENTSVVINFQTPIVSTTADNNFTGQTTAASVYITASGYEI